MATGRGLSYSTKKTINLLPTLAIYFRPVTSASDHVVRVCAVRQLLRHDRRRPQRHGLPQHGLRLRPGDQRLEEDGCQRPAHGAIQPARRAPEGGQPPGVLSACGKHAFDQHITASLLFDQ